MGLTCACLRAVEITPRPNEDICSPRRTDRKWAWSLRLSHGMRWNILTRWEPTNGSCSMSCDRSCDWTWKCDTTYVYTVEYSIWSCEFVINITRYQSIGWHIYEFVNCKSYTLVPEKTAGDIKKISDNSYYVSWSRISWCELLTNRLLTFPVGHFN